MINTAKKILTDNQAINDLDLEPIKFLMQQNPSFYKWDEELTNHVAEMYRSFLYLIWKYPTEDIHPTYEVDVFWHGHILDTRKYVEDCERIFGKYVHHYPYAGLLGDESVEEAEAVANRTIELIRQEFPHLLT